MGTDLSLECLNFIYKKLFIDKNDKTEGLENIYSEADYYLRKELYCFSKQQIDLSLMLR